MTPQRYIPRSLDVTEEELIELMKQAVENADREKFMIFCLDTKNKPTLINIVSVGSINKSIVHPR